MVQIIKISIFAALMTGFIVATTIKEKRIKKHERTRNSTTQPISR